MVAITAKKQALHDKMANCLVVNKAVTADRIKEDGLASPLSKPVLVGLIVFTCCIPVTGIIAAIVVPAYQDYTYRSNRFTHNVKNQQPNPRPGRAPSDGSFADSREANIRPLPPVQLSEAQYEVESDKLLSAHDWPNLEILSLQWTTQFPSNSKAWNTLAIAETNSRKFDEALIAYNQALKLSPNNPVIIDNINRNNIFKDNDGLAVQANEYRKNNEWFALENHSLQWTKKYKDNPWGWNFLGLAYLANGKLKPSLQAFEKALSYLPGDEIILQNIAIAKNFIENQRRDVAIEPRNGLGKGEIFDRAATPRIVGFGRHIKPDADKRISRCSGQGEPHYLCAQTMRRGNSRPLRS